MPKLVAIQSFGPHFSNNLSFRKAFVSKKVRTVGLFVPLDLDMFIDYRPEHIHALDGNARRDSIAFVLGASWKARNRCQRRVNAVA
jgi:hypothetical protein